MLRVNTKISLKWVHKEFTTPVHILHSGFFFRPRTWLEKWKMHLSGTCRTLSGWMTRRDRQRWIRYVDTVVMYGTIFGSRYNNHNTVWCHYNVVNFLQSPQNVHPIPHPWGWGMGCLLSASSDWCSASVTAGIYALSCYIGLRYYGNRLYIYFLFFL